MNPEIPAGVYSVLGGDAYDRKRASFRLRGERLDPEAVTKLTGITPNEAHRRGDPRQVGGKDDLGSWRSGLWSIDSAPALPEEGTHLEDHVAWLLDRLEPWVEQLRQLCADQQLKADFFCGYFMQQSNGGVEVTPETLQRIAALGATFGIDIYAPGPGALERSIMVGG